LAKGAQGNTTEEKASKIYMRRIDWPVLHSLFINQTWVSDATFIWEGPIRSQVLNHCIGASSSYTREKIGSIAGTQE
jgi:hypothetical protein